MMRILKLSLAGIAALLLLALATAWLSVRASLPQLDGEIKAAGLSGPATIERDAEGIPVITAGSRADLAFATGFAHGQDRFFQMDLIRRQASGGLSELFGSAAVEADKRYRFHGFRGLAEQVIAAASDEEQGVMQSYSNGVNAGLDSLGARPFEYLLLRQTPQPWSAEDSVLVVYAMFMQLNDSRARKDVRRGYAHRVLDSGIYAWLYPDGTNWDAPLMGEPRLPESLPASDEFAVRDLESDVLPTEEKGRPPLDGSNNWAVSGALTETGRAIVSNDMHLGLSVPNIYYQARFVQTGAEPRDLTGVTLPGAPMVIAGSNGFMAWGYTNSYGDWSDAVVLQPGDAPGTYKTPDGDRAFTLRKEIIKVAGGEPVEYEVRETIWGPVDDAVSYPDGEIVVSWIAHHPEAVNLNILKLETAMNSAEAMEIANTMGMPPQNFVTGDAGGNVGWTIAGRIPIKADYNPMVPADWSNTHGWSGWREPGEYPRVYNPDNGRIWTANARVADAAALEIIGDGGYDLAARAWQIREGLFAKDRFTPEDMLAIQYDDRALFLERWRELLLGVLSDELVAGNDDLAEYRQLVENWIPRAAPDSVGYRLVRAFRLEVANRVFSGLTAGVRAEYDGTVNLLRSNQFEAPLWRLLERRPTHLLSSNYESWEDLLLASVQENVRWFHENFNGPLAERSWGERNTARIGHPLSRAMPVLGNWLNMPAEPLSGDSNLPKAQGPGFGASERFSVSPGDEKNGLMHMPTGQSGHPMSDFYRAGHDSWVKGEVSPFLPGEAAYTLTLVPAGVTLSEASE